MGFIKIIRWRVGGGALNRVNQQSQSFEIGPLQRAAIFLIVLGREHGLLVFDEFSKDEAKLMSREINRFNEVKVELAHDVLAEFLQGREIDKLPSYVSRDEPDEIARALVRANAKAVADHLKFLWLTPGKWEYGEPGEDDALLELEYEDLEPAQRAAVFMMWLPPELSSMVLAKFSPNLVHRVTGILVELPFVTPQAKEAVLGEFMEGLSLGIPGLSVGDVGVPIVVEAFVRSDPEAVASRLESLWLSQSSVVVPAAPVEEPPETVLTSMEKAAIFLQSLSLPLAYKLLQLMETAEVDSLLEAVDQLSGVDSETRKNVLQELMLASKPELQDQPQPIHILGKAMGQMIRRRPEVVVNQVRKQWLSSEASEN